MRRSDSLFLRILLAFTVISFMVLGCGSGEKGTSETTEETEINTEVTLEELPPGALPDVPAELGGEGFTGEGWLSNFDTPPVGSPEAVKGGTLRMSLYEFPSTLRTVGKDANSSFMNTIGNLVYEGMIGTHPQTMQVTPALATHWQISEDKMTFRFRLNPNARFADGSRLTTADVLATWKLQLDPGILAPYSNILWGKYEEPVIESPYILSVKCKELNWKFFIYFGGMNILPTKYISKLSGADYLKAYQFKMMPGSGPYELDESKTLKGRSLSMKRRWNYWDENNPNSVGVSNFEYLKFNVITDERLIFEKFKKGETDFMQIGRAAWWVEETDFDDVKRGIIQKRKIYNDDPQGASGLAFNMRKPPFDDIRMRQAITYLLNRQKLIDNLFYNEYIFTDSYWPGGVYENPDNPKFRYDPDKAVALLKECGWKDRNQEGWLINDEGAVFELDLMFDSKGFERILTVFQEDLKDVGIKLNLKQTTGPTAFKMLNERKFSIHWQNWGGLFFPNPENVWASWLADPDNTNNSPGVKNERIDELCKAYNVEFDFGKRVEMIREIDKILMEIQPYALGWYAPHHRILYWNKFGHPDFYFSRTGDWSSIIAYWWIDPEKEKKMNEAIKDGNIQLDVGETEVMYWPEYNKKQGRKYEIKGM